LPAEVSRRRHGRQVSGQRADDSVVYDAWRSSLRPVAYVVVGLAIAMLSCLTVATSATDAVPVAASAIITLCAAGVVWWFSLPADVFGRREATLAVALIWLCTGVFGGLPLVIGADLPPADAFFEAVSGFTTTGATVITAIEATVSRPLMLWRSLMQWLGGMGVVVLFVAVFPSVGAGGKHLFRGEVPGPSAEGLVPRIRSTSRVLWEIYAALTVAEVAALWLAGMGLFDAVCHSMTTLSTGGFSTHDASAAAFHSPLIEVILSVFMLLSGMNFSLYYGALVQGSWRVFARSTEFRAYLAIIVGSTALLTLLIRSLHPTYGVALQKAFFMVATLLTSTGYGNGEDYMAYPGGGVALLLIIMFLGGMAGSTAGGIKTARVVVLLKLAWSQTRATIRPSVVQVVRMDGKPVPVAVLSEVGAFLVVFMVTLAASTLTISIIEGEAAEKTFGAVLSCLSNMGPAPYHLLNADHYADYSAISKILFGLVMILGRLEFFTLLALMLPDFWSGFRRSRRGGS